MGTMPKDPAREHRIVFEAVVDAYGEAERALGWYYYLEDRLRFPFAATCSAERATSPLRVDEVVEVIAMAGEDECEHDMLVSIRWNDRDLAVPLAQIRPVGGDAETRQAVEDWRYWVARGYRF